MSTTTARGMRRQEGRGKVDGSTRFTADLELPGLLHVQLVLSLYPSARLRSYDLTAARAVPGVVVSPGFRIGTPQEDQSKSPWIFR